MRKVILPIVAIVFCAWIPAAASYLAINSLLDSLHGALGQQPIYSIEADGNQIVLTHIASGMASCTIRQADAQTVTLSASIARLPLGSQKQLERVAEQISDFNVSSPIGTLRLDEHTGEIRMEHYVNAAIAPSSAVASVAVRFADVAREQSARFSRTM